MGSDHSTHKTSSKQNARMLTVYHNLATAEARLRSLLYPLSNLFGQLALTIFYILVDTNPLFDYSWWDNWEPITWSSSLGQTPFPAKLTHREFLPHVCLTERLLSSLRSFCFFAFPNPKWEGSTLLRTVTQYWRQRLNVLCFKMDSHVSQLQQDVCAVSIFRDTPVNAHVGAQ